MFDSSHYVPVLKWKLGEQRALRGLPDEVRRGMTPLLEMLPVPPPKPPSKEMARKTRKPRPPATLDSHIASSCTEIALAWGQDYEAFVDLHLLDAGQCMSTGEHAVSGLFARLQKRRVKAIPVTSFSRGDEHRAAVVETCKKFSLGCCIRLSEDEALASDLGARLRGLLRELPMAPLDIDIVIDFGAIETGQEARNSEALAALLGRFPRVESWRSLTVVSSSFPRYLTELKRGTNRVTRTDWNAWCMLRERPGVPRVPTFGDYAIQHPELAEFELPSEIIRVSAQLRYTCESDWLIFKGRKTSSEGGFEQFRGFCRELVGRDEFSGGGFSAGDTYIDRCARGEESPGNAQTWRWIGTSHHLSFVRHQLANQPVLSLSL